MIIKDINFISAIEKSNDNINVNNNNIFNKRQWPAPPPGWQPPQGWQPPPVNWQPPQGWQPPPPVKENNNANPTKAVNKTGSSAKSEFLKEESSDKSSTVNPVNSAIANEEKIEENVESFSNDNAIEISRNDASQSYHDNSMNKNSEISIDGNSKGGNNTGSTIATVSIIVAIIALFIAGGFIFIHKKRVYDRNNRNKENIENKENGNFEEIVINGNNDENKKDLSCNNNKEVVINTDSFNSMERPETLKYEPDHGIINAFHDLLVDDDNRRESSNVTLITDDDEKQLIKGN